ncbi:hypothetical protein SAMN04488128_101592 [Chitinophaga eiseniae]|uniref:Uncharacterized protein n=1 Tax=Chitinophaga eiseniae TaxID=634771 RepID=A0A1T4LDC9_9BACT|nr:hypothetical protein SAMN04488128_101592 [Chitinophaga eiseniae]
MIKTDFADSTNHFGDAGRWMKMKTEMKTEMKTKMKTKMER